MDMAQSAKADIQTMLQDAIVAVQAATAAAHQATLKIEHMATHPALQEALKQGSANAETWRQRLAEAATQADAASQPALAGNPIIDAIQQAGGKIIHKATDPAARDLGIVASGQLALHYYIAAFGTMAAYAKLLGLHDAAQSLHACLEEAKRGDERYTELAAEIAK